MYTVLIVVLVLLLLGGLPNWGWHQWGYSPAGIVLVLLALWLLFGRRL